MPWAGLLPPKTFECFWCGAKRVKFITKDHVIPVSFGGGNGCNIVWACQPCNNERGRVSAAIKNNELKFVRPLYDKWVAIECRLIGHSPTESLIKMVAEKKAEKEAAQASKKVKEPKPYTPSPPKQQNQEKFLKSSKRMEVAIEAEWLEWHNKISQPEPPVAPPPVPHPLGNKRQRTMLYAAERMRWMDDGGQNMDDALGPNA